MKIKDYSLIETQFIDNYIQILSDKIESASEEPLIDFIYIDDWAKQKELLMKVKSKLKPLINIVENSFDTGYNYGFDSADPNSFYLDYPNLKDYINNTIIE